MTQLVLTVGPAHTLREASRMMSARRVGAAVVIDHDHSGIGILTERDILDSVGAGQDPDTEVVADHRTEDVVFASPDWTVDEAAAAMVRGNFRHLIVIDGGEVTGLLSMRDIIRLWSGAAFTSDIPRIPVRIYLARGEEPDPVDRAVLGVLEAFEFRVEHLGVPVAGSWFRELWTRVKASAPPAETQFIKIARAIELQGLDRPQSEVDVNQADAVARLLCALEPESDALIQIGSIFLIKVASKVIVRNLTQTELAYFNQHPALFQDPDKALQHLQEGYPQDSQPYSLDS
jgi:hypothetical protein